MGRLPAGYQELTHIESTGTQWIDTGIPRLNEYHDLWNVVARTTSGTNKTILISTFTDRNGTWFGTRNNKWTANESSNSDFDATEFSQIEALFEKNTTTKPSATISVDGNSWSFQRSSDITVSTGSIYLFAGSQAGYRYCFSGQVNHISLIRNGTQIIDLIPCRRLSDSAIGMFDLVSQSFFGNSGTGEFIAGAPIIEPTWGSGLAQVTQKELLARRSLIMDANAICYGKSVQNGTPSIRNKVDFTDSIVKKIGNNLYPFAGTLPVPLRGIRLGTTAPTWSDTTGVWFDGTDYWVSDFYNPTTGEYVQRIREVVMTGVSPYNATSCYNQRNNTFLIYNSYTSLTSGAPDLSKGSYGPLCNYAVGKPDTIFYSDDERIGSYSNHRMTFCVRYPYSYWGIEKNEKTANELVALVNELLKERYEAGVPYVYRYVLLNPIRMDVR